jgi:predicted Zn-dependent protease with MMP-like domain
LVSRSQFDHLVEEALRELPQRFSSLLENVAIVVEEEPSDDDLDETDEDELLGIYRGTPLTERTHDMIAPLPDQIAIFRGPILRIATTPREIVEEVRDTVVHELGHYFGLSDEDMEY